MKTMTSIVYKSALINILTKFHKDWMKTTNILTKFHKDWMKTVTSIVYTSFHQDNILTKFHKDWMKTATSIVCTSDLINILTKFHKDWMKTVTSTVYTKQIVDGRTHTRTTDAEHHTFHSPAAWGLCLVAKIEFLTKINILTKFHKDWMKTTNILTKFHEDWIKIVTSIVYTRDWEKTVTSTVYTSKLLTDTRTHTRTHIRTRDITQSHKLTMSLCDSERTGLEIEDRKINVASREKCPVPWRPCFQPTGIIFELVQDIIGLNLLTKFHENWTINVASRVKNAPPHGRHVFQAKTNLLSKFHEDRNIMFYYSHIHVRKNAPSPGGHVFQPTSIIFELVQDIIGMNLLTNKIAPPLGSHVFQANVTIFELIQDIIETNLLTKFHED
ncbi:hypothetical protein DPMN_062987 [Dreissena polymorpha]|uniref:Uncharacterized protein n=1 Tax=Dreissena polymorpha TaxID=45954 RepID=A0A9D4HJR1_DREPO|nr:hypothetical protein DPMN_062987 [Dreissena polymorpha]